MKIILGIWAVRIGGAETFAVELAKFLIKNQCEVYIFPINTSHDYQYFNSIRNAGITIMTPFKPGIIDWLSWKINGVSNKLFNFNVRDYVNKQFLDFKLKNEKFNLLISNAFKLDEYISNKKIVNFRYIIIEHGDYSKSIVEGLNLPLKALKSADEIVCVSRWSNDMLQKCIKSSNLKVIYNGHNQKHLTKLENEITAALKDKFVFGMIGRSDPQKGWEDAIKSFLTVNSLFPDTRLLLIGGGEYLDFLRSKYQNSNILFTGYQTEPQNYIQYVDVGLMLSQKYEAFGLAILDFFSQGKPVIANSIGGIPEVVKRGDLQGGILVLKKEEQYIDEVVSSMRIMVSDNHLKDQFSEHAKKIYTEFSFEKTGSEYLKLIDQIDSQNA